MTENAPLITGLDHLMILVRDLAAAETVYTRMFGREPSWRGGHPKLGTRNVLYRLRHCYVELLSPVGSGASADRLNRLLEENGEGIAALAFATPDAEDAAKRLKAAGFDVQGPVQGEGTDEITGHKRDWMNLFVSGPDTKGLFFFLIEHKSPEALLPPAPLAPGAEERSAVDDLDHVVVMTPEPDAIAELFGGKLRIRLALDHSKPEWGVRQLFFRTGGITLEVVAPLDEKRMPAKNHYWGLAWEVPDLEAAQARIAAAGADVSEVRTGRKTGTKVATVRKPTGGVPTLLIEQPKRG